MGIRLIHVKLFDGGFCTFGLAYEQWILCHQYWVNKNSLDKVAKARS